MLHELDYNEYGDAFQYWDEMMCRIRNMLESHLLSNWKYCIAIASLIHFVFLCVQI